MSASEMGAILGCPGCEALTKRLEAADANNAIHTDLHACNQEIINAAELRLREAEGLLRRAFGMLQSEHAEALQCRKEMGGPWPDRDTGACELLREMQDALAPDSALPDEPRVLLSGTLRADYGDGKRTRILMESSDLAWLEKMCRSLASRPSLPDEPPPAPLQPGAKCSNGFEFWCSLHCPLDNAGEGMRGNCGGERALCSEHCAP